MDPLQKLDGVPCLGSLHEYGQVVKEADYSLNVQRTKEAHASRTYLSYAAGTEKEGLQGTANSLFRHAPKERNHLMKI